MTHCSEVAIVGAGFGGLALAHRLALDGLDDVVLFERDDGVGGTWRANSYPGAACDVPSHLYSLSVAPNPSWSRAYATQPEILRYVENCYDQFDVRRKVRPGTEIVAANWSGRCAGGYATDSARGSKHGRRHRYRHIPQPGSSSDIRPRRFAGARFHSARWKRDHDLTGERVAVVGTGASAIQIVPAIADRVAHLDLYQRTPPVDPPPKRPAVHNGAAAVVRGTS